MYGRFREEKPSGRRLSRKFHSDMQRRTMEVSSSRDSCPEIPNEWSTPYFRMGLLDDVRFVRPSQLCPSLLPRCVSFEFPDRLQVEESACH
jgi:hypothetical protein